MKQIPEIIAKIAGRAEIVAATKTQSADLINELKKYGITKAGENRVQEFLDKYDKVSGMEWHFIGRLQTNKVKYIVDKVTLIHSLDRVSLADEIEAQCAKRNTIMNVLIELNAGEESKGGIDKNELNRFAEYVQKLPHLRLKGLMCMPPLDCGKSAYESVNNVFIQFQKDFGKMDYLSLGTSHDYMTAIEHGSNMVRLGTVLFGSRAALQTALQTAPQ